MGLSHSHFVPGIVTALTAFPLALPHRGSGDIEMGEGGHGILQGLGPGLVFPSSGGLRQQPRSMMSASDLRSYCPVGVFFLLFFPFYFCTATRACRFVSLLPCHSGAQSPSACGPKPGTGSASRRTPALCGCSSGLGSETPLRRGLHCKPARLLPVSRPFEGPEPMCGVPLGLGLPPPGHFSAW